MFDVYLIKDSDFEADGNARNFEGRIAFFRKAFHFYARNTRNAVKYIDYQCIQIFSKINTR